MHVYSSDLWWKDIDQTINTLPELSRLEEKTVLITGATGLICSAVADILIRYNETHDKRINIIAAGRSRERTEKRFAEYANKDYFRFIFFDSSKTDNQITIPCDYIIHGASNAYPGIIIKEPVETMMSNFTGLLQLFQYAKECNAKRILYISSSEVYGKKETLDPFKEDEYGYIDLLNPRNSYSVGKRAAETLCASYSSEYGIESVIVRPGHIYGPTASEKDNRVSSIWAYAAARGEDITMNSDGAQLRSYCYCLDCASAMLKVLIDGENGNAYNISNPDSIITIRQMAELLTESAGVQLIRGYASEAEKKSYNPMMNSSLDSTKLENLGWKGLFDAPTGFAHTVQLLKK